ncbi:restriction endonuclease subunit S [Pseudarthrobacter sp. J1738]|uniref:restriction endonuclease subunit S n=1 Tax=Pseudarthrobacter sp. J1738 TaxID=3420446 RepID=UPI003D2C26C5
MIWSETTIAAEFEVQLGKMLDFARNSGDPKLYIGNRAVQWGYIDLSSASYVPLTRQDVLRFRLRKGDLLVCEGGEVGRAAIWEYDVECYYQKALHRLRPRREYNARVLLAILELRAKSGGFADYVTQTSIAHLPRDKFLTLPIPSIPEDEQQRIATVLADADCLIDALQRLIAKKRDVKQGMMQELLTGRTRLPGFTGEWRGRRLGDLLAYEQPGRYLVSSAEYIEAGGVPVLTAGKTFVLGHTNESHGVYDSLPVVIFDDFTTASKYVTFPFKAKSSAMKMLSAKSGANLRFAYERMQLIDFPIADHKRRWIAEFSKLEVSVPSFEEQKAIASVLENADAEISALERRLESARAVKQGMMQELLTGRTRLLAKVAA